MSLLSNFTHHQVSRIKYLHDLKRRIPYCEIQQIEVYLKSILKKLIVI